MGRVMQLIAELHPHILQPVRGVPFWPLPKEETDLRQALHDEEFEELEEAMAGDNIVALADALGDLVTVLYGTALHAGIDLDEVVEEIHASNMTKDAPDRLGKAVKGERYRPPALGLLLASQTRRRAVERYVAKGEVADREMAVEDAERYGVGYLVDGRRVAPQAVIVLARRPDGELEERQQFGTVAEAAEAQVTLGRALGSPGDPAWECGACGQRNVGWAARCGRCSSIRGEPDGERGESSVTVTYPEEEADGGVTYAEARAGSALREQLAVAGNLLGPEAVQAVAALLPPTGPRGREDRTDRERWARRILEAALEAEAAARRDALTVTDADVVEVAAHPPEMRNVALYEEGDVLEAFRQWNDQLLSVGSAHPEADFVKFLRGEK